MVAKNTAIHPSPKGKGLLADEDKDIFCPKCNKEISLKSSLVYNDEQINILGVIYLIKCVKCDPTFISDLRTGVKKIYGNDVTDN